MPLIIGLCAWLWGHCPIFQVCPLPGLTKVLAKFAVTMPPIAPIYLHTRWFLFCLPIQHSHFHILEGWQNSGQSLTEKNETDTPWTCIKSCPGHVTSEIRCPGHICGLNCGTCWGQGSLSMHTLVLLCCFNHWLHLSHEILGMWTKEQYLPSCTNHSENPFLNVISMHTTHYLQITPAFCENLLLSTSWAPLSLA